MSKVTSSTSKTSTSSKSSLKGLSGKGAGKAGTGGKAGKSARVKSGLGKVSGGKSMKASGSKSTKGKTGHKSQKAGEMQNPFKQLGNFLGNVLGTGGGTGSVKGSSGKKSGGSHRAGKSSSAGKTRSTGKSSSAGKTRGTGKSNSAAKSHGAGKTHSTGKSQKTGGTPTGNKTGDKDSVKKSPSETGQKPSAEQVKGQEKPSAGEGGKVMGTAKGTGYYPSNSKMEGGYVDKKGNKLTTLQDVLDGKAKSAAIALDKNLYKSGQVKYGDSFTIPEIDKKYGRHIDFRAVDTGGAFTNKGFSRVDVCTRSNKDAHDPTINGKLTLIKNSNLSPEAKAEKVQETIKNQGNKSTSQTPDKISGNDKVNLKPGGGWGGTQGPVQNLAKLAEGEGLHVSSAKRDRRSTKSGGVSDHWTGNQNAYANDYGWGGKRPTAQSDASASKIVAALGGPADWGKKGGNFKTVVNGIRYQVIYRSNVGGNHFNHIHVGAKKVGE